MSHSNVAKLVEEKTKVYHGYARNILTRRKIIDEILKLHEETHGHLMSEQFEEFLWDLINKVTRIALEPTLLDTWKDIQGYAYLVEQYLTETGTAYELRTQSEDEVEPGTKD